MKSRKPEKAMDALVPQTYIYRYEKPRLGVSGKREKNRGAIPPHLRARLYKMPHQYLQYYEEAGNPYGINAIGLLIWVEFGRRSLKN